MRIKLTGMRLSTRMILLVGVLIGSLFISNGIAISKLNTIRGYLVEIAENDIPITNLLAEITTKQVKQALVVERAVRITLEFDQYADELDAEQQKFTELSDKINENIASAITIAGKGISNARNAVAAEKFEKLTNDLKTLNTKHKVFDDHSFELLENLKDQGFSSQLESAFINIEEEETLLISQLERLLVDLESFTADTALEAAHLEQAALKLIISVFIFGTLMGLFVSFTTFRNVNRQMGSDPQNIMNFATAVKDGELRPMDGESKNKKLTGVYDAMVNMRSGLANVVNSIKDTADVVQIDSIEIAQKNRDLSSRTEEQSKKLEATASNIIELTSSVKHNADNAMQANELVKSTRNQAESGGDVVNSAVTAMSEINQSSTEIANIITVIDEIAFQTNLLALNAAVEAARAGEQGRGFAVVASEVRQLAGRSAEAAKQITDLIRNSEAKVESGTQLVNLSGKTLNEIVGSVQQVSDLVDQITSSCQEQSLAIDHINEAIQSIDGLTQQNASVVEQVAVSSEAISKQAKELSRSVAFFKTDKNKGVANL